MDPRRGVEWGFGGKAPVVTVFTMTVVIVEDKHPTCIGGLRTSWNEGQSRSEDQVPVLKGGLTRTNSASSAREQQRKHTNHKLTAHRCCLFVFRPP